MNQQQIIEEGQARLSMIRDSVGAIMTDGQDFGRIRQLRFTEPGMDPQVWQLMGDMGWLGLRLPETAGGIGMGLLELTTLLEALGEGLVPEPLIEGAMAVCLLPAAPRTQALAGETLVLPVGLPGLAAAAPVQLREGALQGVLQHVPMAQAATDFLVYTPQGLALLPQAAVNVSVVLTQDGGHFGSFSVTGLVPQWVLPVAEGQLQCLWDEACLASSAYLLGVMQAAFRMTQDYLNLRVQFGRRLSSFQALQHRMVDLYLQIELTRAIVAKTATFMDDALANGTELNPATVQMRQRLVSVTKIRAAQSALLVTREAIQLHGGIGYTDEADIGLFLRKAMTWLNRYGSVEAHRQRYLSLAAGPSHE
ncbi:MAG: acyl-CoA dehydrogenase family protein [Neisseriaceae bacterium]|nr:acyl-CoA dehydrogenase family protein [Neisseriaceae bacterium]